MKNKSMILLLILAANFKVLLAQLPSNTNLAWINSYQGTTLGSGTEDWIYGVVGLPGGGAAVTGYGIIPSVSQNPIVMLVSAAGGVVWEKSYPCISGTGFDIFDHPSGFLIIGRGNRPGTCGTPSGMFSMLVDKTNGNIVNSYGIKFYNEQTVPFPNAQNGLVNTIIGELVTAKPRSCEIRNSSGAVTGYMICGNYNDNSYPTNASSLPHMTTGCFLLKIDMKGLADPSFGTNGLQTFWQNSTGKYFNPHVYNVCVNYDGGGNVQGYVVVGGINENISTLPPLNGSMDKDAVVFMVDQFGGTTHADVFDEWQHNKNTGTPSSYVYVDIPDPAICSNQQSGYPSQENNNQKAVRVKQKYNGGPFIILSQFDYTFYSIFSPPCTNVYPPTFNFHIHCDPSLIEMDQTGNFTWSLNLYHSFGRDFENDLLVNNSDPSFRINWYRTLPRNACQSASSNLED